MDGRGPKRLLPSSSLPLIAAIAGAHTHTQPTNKTDSSVCFLADDRRCHDDLFISSFCNTLRTTTAGGSSTDKGGGPSPEPTSKQPRPEGRMTEPGNGGTVPTDANEGGLRLLQEASHPLFLLAPRPALNPARRRPPYPSPKAAWGSSQPRPGRRVPARAARTSASALRGKRGRRTRRWPWWRTSSRA